MEMILERVVAFGVGDLSAAVARQGLYQFNERLAHYPYTYGMVDILRRLAALPRAVRRVESTRGGGS